ncbi:hypothetical protein HOC32_04070 [Candidatus Woesearchaeota archaeon]|jgi:hypothetical protein|nr:hypothetical protein [Candidatus Woesearchaeota archaeon]
MMFSSKRKRGQMEVIGLVVIVILISVAFLFMAQFALKESPAKKIFTRKGLASSALAAVMKTTVDPADDCGLSNAHGALSLETEILEDCAQHFPISSTLNSVYKCGGGQHSCAFFEETAKTLLDDTLGEWNKRYQLDIEVVTNDKPKTLISFPSEKGGCPENRERDTSGTFFLRAEPSLVRSVLYVCD